MDSVAGLKGKHFAVIIDEAHSPTAGKDVAAATMPLGSGDIEAGKADVEDLVTDQIRRNGKQANVSMFAFTATPKPTTIRLFGRLNTKGHREAFHVYSMKQAIEEGFVLDVFQNYTTYDTFYQINKEIEEDPQMKTASAKRQITRFAELPETNIAQRVEVVVEHFRTTVMSELGGMTKVMAITASRQGAVKYRQAFKDYTKKKGHTDIKALVSFSGKAKLSTAESFDLTEAKKERLSRIIAEINSRTGKAYDNDTAVRAMLQIRGILMKSDKLKTSAKSNTAKDFELSCFDDIDDALIESLEQNQDFFSLIFSNNETKEQVLDILAEKIYKGLREA